MAVKTYYVASGNDGNFGALVDGVAQAAASRVDGWTVAKIGVTNESDFDAGTKQLSTTFASGQGKPVSFLTGTTANAFKTPVALNGTYANTVWTFTFAVRATVASSQAGKMVCMIYRGTAANGSNAVLIANTKPGGQGINGTATTALSTSADATSVVTWTPTAPIVLANEYLFFVLAWQITTASGSTTGDVLIRTGSSGPAGSRCVTSDFVAVLPKISTLTDTFDTTVDKVTNWPNSSAATVWDSVGKRAQLPCATAYSALNTNSTTPGYDLTGSQITARVYPPQTGTGTREMFMEMIRDSAATDKLSIYVSGGNLNARRMLAGANSGTATAVPYNPFAHAAWRIRESGGTTFFDTSPDGVTWTNFWSVANGMVVTSMWLSFSCGYYGTETADNGYVDYVNATLPKNTPIQLDATMTLTAALGKKAVFKRALAATATLGPLVSLKNVFKRSFSATTILTPGLSNVYSPPAPAVIAFPSTPALDNFNRADGPPGANYGVALSGYGVGSIASNKWTPGSSNSSLYYNTKFGPDQEIYITVVTPTTIELDLLLRWPGQDGPGYDLSISDTIWGFYTWGSGTSTLFTTIDTGQSLAAGESVGFRVIGNTLSAWRRSPGGSWTKVLQYTDPAATFTAANYIGWFAQPGFVLDDLGGGTVSTFPATPVLDNFNRADGALGANWTQDNTGDGPMTIVSNQASVPASTYGYMSWANPISNPNCEVYATVSKISSQRLYLRVDDLTLWTNAYWMKATTTGFVIYNADGHSIAEWDFPISSGDGIGFRAIGSTLSAWYRPGATGAWTSVGQIEDTRSLGSGYIGIDVDSNSSSFDNFGGGVAIAIPAVNTPISLNASLVLTTALSKKGIYTRAMPVSSPISPGLARVAKRSRSLAATSTLTPSLSRLAFYPRALAVVATLAPTISRKLSAFRNFDATTAVNPAMQANRSANRSFSVTTTFVPSMTNVKKFFRGLAASITVAPTMNRFLAGGRLFATSATFTPTMARKLSAFRLLSVGGVGSVASDNFNRADGGLGPNWATNAEGNNPLISGNKVTTVAISSATWVGNTFGNDQFAQIDNMTNFPDASTVSGLILRSQLSGATCYHARYFSNAGSPVFQIYKRTSPGALTQIGSNVTAPACVPTDVLRFEISGNTLTLLFNGVVQMTLTDSSIPSGGAPGIRLNGSGTVDNFQGGDLVSGSVFTPTMVRNFKANRAFAANIVLTPDMQKVFFHPAGSTPISLNATMTMIPTMGTYKQYFRALAVTAVFAPTVSKRLLALRLLAVSTPLVPLLTARKAAARLLAAPVTISASMSRFLRGSRSLNAATTVIPNMSLGNSKNQFLNRPISFATDMGRSMTMKLATSVNFITGSQRKTSKSMPLTIMLSPTLDEQTHRWRIFDSVTTLQADLKTNSAKKITFSTQVPFTVTITAGRINRIILSVGGIFNALMAFVRHLGSEKRTDKVLLSAAIPEAQLLAAMDATAVATLENVSQEEIAILLSANTENPELASAGEEAPGLRSVS